MRSRIFTVLAVAMLAWASVLLVADFAAAQGASSSAQYQQRDDLTFDRFDDDFNNSNFDDNVAADTRREAGEFRCADIVEISRSAARDQYNFSAARLQECLAREVIGDTKGRLADTGGPPLLLFAALASFACAVVAGVSLLRAATRSR